MEDVKQINISVLESEDGSPLTFEGTAESEFATLLTVCVYLVSACTHFELF